MRLNFLYAGSRSQLRAMHNSPNTVNPTKIKVVEPQLAADPYGLRGSAADSSGGRILASAGGDLSTYSGKPLSLPAKASNDLDAALDWMQREGRNIEQYVNKKAAPMEQALQTVRMQEYILLASRNSLKDGNLISSLNAFHPIKYFDEIRGELGQKYGGDVLWEKIAEAAKRNTERVACFVAGTLVHTKEGLRPIEQIKVGDYVLSKPESGSGETAYKRVVRTIESEAQETWFVSWYDPELLKKLKEGISEKEYFASYGNGFVITTPNHPFWVVDSDEEWLKYAESHVRLGPPYPKQQWVRADHLAAGMKLLLADGRVVDVVTSTRVYKTLDEYRGWVDYVEDGSKGLIVDFANSQVMPDVHIYAYQFQPTKSMRYGLVENPNEAHADDYPPGSAPESWYLSKVYNLEVEDSHTYFVDTMGVWVHNTNCGGYQRLDSVQKVYTDTKEFNNYVKDLPDAELTGTRVVPDTKAEAALRTEDSWQGAQYNTYGAPFDPKSNQLFAVAVLGKSPFGTSVAERYGKHGNAFAHIDAGNGTPVAVAATMDVKGGGGNSVM